MTDAMIATPGLLADLRRPVTEPAEDFPRIGTGNREADEVLGGGFPANSINIVMGQPGSGKTIFVEELLFHNASAPGEVDGRSVLYLTTLSEPLPKVVSYLQRFAFFDIEKLGTTVIYDDIGAELAEHGVESLVPRIRALLTSLSPRVIIIDSFKALHDLEPSLPKIRRMISELAGLLSAYDTTTFLVGEYAEENNSLYPEFAVADAIVEFARTALSTRDERYFRVSKLRGSAYREGSHGVRITSRGIEIYPRLVTPKLPAGYTPIIERVPSGTEGLDALMGGGLWRGSVSLVAGPTGSGKTTLGLQFAIQGVRLGEPALYVNFQENPTQMARLLRGFGEDPDGLRERGLHLLYASPVELQIDSIIVEIFRLIRQSSIRRVVVDALGELYASASDPARLHDYLYSLVQHLTVNTVSTILTYETGASEMGHSTLSDERFGYMSDNILMLGLEARPESARRTIRVTKMRNSEHDSGVHDLLVDATGMRVSPA